MIMVDADPGLDRYRYAVRRGRLDGSLQDHSKSVALVGQRCAATLTSDLRNWAPEVQVDVADAVLIAQDLCGARHDHRMHAVQLNGANSLALVELQHRQRLTVMLHESA